MQKYKQCFIRIQIRLIVILESAFRVYLTVILRNVFRVYFPVILGSVYNITLENFHNLSIKNT